MSIKVVQFQIGWAVSLSHFPDERESHRQYGVFQITFVMQHTRYDTSTTVMTTYNRRFQSCLQYVYSTEETVLYSRKFLLRFICFRIVTTAWLFTVLISSYPCMARHGRLVGSFPPPRVRSYRPAPPRPSSTTGLDLNSCAPWRPWQSQSGDMIRHVVCEHR